MNFPEAIPPKDFTECFTNYEPSFSITLKEFTDPTFNLESLTAKPKLLKTNATNQTCSSNISAEGTGT